MWSNNEPKKQSYIVVEEEGRETGCSHTAARAGVEAPDRAGVAVCLSAGRFAHCVLLSQHPPPAHPGGQDEQWLPLF